MATLEIIGAPQSNFVRTTRIACMEEDVPYTLNPARPHTPDADAIHPFGKIPVMRHGDVTLCESTGICVYIDRAFDGQVENQSEPSRGQPRRGGEGIERRQRRLARNRHFTVVVQRRAAA